MHQIAVKQQIWIAISSNLQVAIWKKQLALGHIIYEIFQNLSISDLDKTHINQIIAKKGEPELNSLESNQLNIFELYLDAYYI